MSRANSFLKKHLGEDFFQFLSKTELWKPGTKSVTDIDDMRIGLKIVPRTVIALLVRELIPMKIGETKEIDLLFGSNAMMRVSKHERDVYSGEIEEDNKRVVDFKLRSLPGVGLVLMSAFELYEEAEDSEPKEAPPEDHQIQRLIDERMALHDLVGKVVEQKMMERDAVHEMVLAKLSLALRMLNEKIDNVGAEKEGPPSIPEPIHIEKKEEKKKRPLADFLEQRKKPKEFSVQLAKGEQVACPDCGKNIFNGNAFSACICYGDSGKVFLKKTEDGFKIRFSKNWDIENIEMLLEVLRKRNG